MTRFVLSLLVSLTAVFAVAQTQGAPVQPAAPVEIPQTASGSAPKSLYRIQVDDIIRVEIKDEIPSTDMIVAPDGNISAPILGLVRAEGLTFTELTENLKAQYIRVLNLQPGFRLQLSVTSVKIRQIRASVIGAVLKPGPYEMRRGDRISNLLADAQGAPTDGSSDLRKATLRHAGSKESIPIDLYSLLTKGDSSQDYEIEDGDVLTVPQEVSNRILIEGEVKQPTTILYTEGLSVAEAITRAGGRTNNSKMTQVTVIRKKPGRPDDPDYIEVNLVDFYTKRDKGQNIELKPGDAIFVPNNGNPDLNQINAYFNIFFLFRAFGFTPF